MATPDIGTSISEGYGRGMDRVGAWLPTLLVYGVIAGVVAGIIAQLQQGLLPDGEEIVKAIFSGGTIDGVSESDLRNASLLGAVGGLVNLLIGFGMYVVIGGALHRERHGGDGSIPGPGAAIPAMLAGIGALMPKVALLAGLGFAAQIAGPLLGTLGNLIGLALVIFLLMVSIRWIYAPVIAGSGEATGDGAFERSEGAVSGSWWGTFGCFIVIGLATFIPFYVGSFIVAAIVPTAFLGALAASIVTTAIGAPIFASALESAWSQVEGGDHGDVPPPAAPPVDQQLPPADEPPSGPFV